MIFEAVYRVGKRVSSYILIILKIPYTRKENEFSLRVIIILLVFWILLLIIERFISRQVGLLWELNYSLLIGIFNYTQLVAIILYTIYWYVMYVKRK